MPDTPAEARCAVLRDFPLRVWSRAQEHSADMLREFQLLAHGARTGQAGSPPAQLLELADLLTTQYGPLLDDIHRTRHEALDRGQDRMDSRVPLVPGAAELLVRVRAVLDAVDEHCRAGELLTLARPPELVALSDWTFRELLAQDAGAQPSPWPGPF